MRIAEGVEWAVHLCAVLGVVPDGYSLPASRLAEFHDLPPDYLAKHLQALSRAGIVTASRGVSGGYRLAKPPRSITLLDITIAIEGSEPAFRCTEIRRQGPCAAGPAACRQLCPIATAFLDAEMQWRMALASVTVADMIKTAASESFDKARRRAFQDWLNDAMK
ncbi:MAG TPA: Rrf2 family transcriptional regulator [Candidatus Binataceae bacterium]|nr:Rrf2 family transcriptional regulator [Candidatus Binataceae bacterium]